MELYLETFEVERLLLEVVDIVKPLVEKNSNQLVLHFGRALGMMHSDQVKVRQALFNLLSNATKFTEAGTITFTVQRYMNENADWLTFCVSDTGIGMNPAQIEKLFQAFTQADVSTTRKFGGTGLGLTITKVFCEMMGGDIDVLSTPGSGSTFTIHLPAYVDAVTGEQIPKAVKSITVR